MDSDVKDFREFIEKLGDSGVLTLVGGMEWAIPKVPGLVLENRRVEGETVSYDYRREPVVADR